MHKPNLEEKTSNILPFLRGGGEMGRLIRAKDWANTPLGNPDQWHPSLVAIVSVILHNPFGMCITWGDENTQLYNDSYIAILGTEKHPEALGKSCQDSFPEVWGDVIAPMFDKVKEGKAVSYTNFEVKILRNGYLETCFFDFAYSPIFIADGKVGGVLLTTIETTNRNTAEQALNESRNQLAFAIEATELGTFDLDPQSGTFTGNERLKAWFGLPPKSKIELQDAIDAIAEEDQERVVAAIDAAFEYENGGQYDIIYSIVHPESFSRRIVRAKGRTWFNEDEIAIRFNGTLQDITKVETNARRLAVVNRKVQSVVANAPYSIGLLTGENHIIEIANQSIIDVWGKGNDVLGKPYFDVLPELKDQSVFSQLNEVYQTGIPLHLENQSIKLVIDGELKNFYFNYDFTPLRNEDNKVYGILVSGIDITESVLSDRKFEESEKRFRDSVKQAPLGIAIFRGDDFTTELVNDTYLTLIDKSEAEVVNKPLFEAIPEVIETVKPLFDEVVRSGEAFHSPALEVELKRHGEKKTAYFNLVYHPLKEGDGSISGIMVVAMEVTDSVLAEKALRVSEEHFRTMVESSPTAMAVLRGPEYKVEMANDKMLSVFWKRKAEDVVGKNMLDIFPELVDQQFPELFAKVLNEGVKVNIDEAVAYVRHGEELVKFYADLEYSPLIEIGGEVTGIIVTANDITAQVNSRKLLENAEERVRLATDATELATWELSFKDRVVIHSPRLAQILGYDADIQISHTRFRDHIHPADLTTVVEAAFDESMTSGIYKYEARVLKANGEIAWIRTQGKVFFDGNNNPLRLIGTVRDITVDKQRQQALEDSEQKFRTLANSMPQFVWTGDKNGNLLYFNNSVFDYSGLSEENVLDGGWIDMVHPDDRELNIKKWKHSIETGEDFLFEHRFRRYDGEYRWQLSRAIPQIDNEGKIVMWVGASTDIQEMKEIDQQKDFFIGMASHELKTPLTSIKGYVQMLQSMYAESEDDFLNNSLKIVDKQIVTLTSLISDLLDLSKIKSGSLVLTKSSFSVNAFIREFIGEMRQINPNCPISFTEIEDRDIVADRDRLGQVLINFLTNAIKYSGEKPVEVKNHYSDGSLILEVEDRGIGISKNDQKRIFERFYRVEGKNETTFPGFGIGLNIASDIIERHDGEIGLESKLGQGSTFYFKIPLGNKE